jgi:hypothetical protein
MAWFEVVGLAVAIWIALSVPTALILSCVLGQLDQRHDCGQDAVPIIAEEDRRPPPPKLVADITTRRLSPCRHPSSH